MSRIPAENISGSTDTDMDAVSLKILILGANTLVIGLLLGKIIVLVDSSVGKHWANLG